MVPILILAALAGSAFSDLVVKSALGTISGELELFENIEVESFRGVPYAKPPVGDLRFAYPQAFGPVGDFKAAKFSPVCPQPKALEKNITSESEDCLYLNVFRRAGTQPNAKKAVLVVIHGGAFSMGAASTDMHNTIAMTALGDVIVVSFNYRLGILGFADMKDLAPGNLGLFDQLLALEWIRENIGAFGGDEEKVTLIGVSAGSMSVGALLASPLVRKKNLFKQVVMDAGVMSRTCMATQDHSLNRVREIAGKLGCAMEGEKMLACLRTADAMQLVDLSYDPKISPIFTFVPTVEGKFLTADVTKDTIENADKFYDVRMIIGVAKNEGTMFTAMYPTARKIETEDDFVVLAGKIARGFLYPTAPEEPRVRNAIVKTYYGKSPSRFTDLAEFLGDGTFICPTNAFVENYAKTHEKVYVYRFERMLKSRFLRFGRIPPAMVGVFHTSSFLHFLGGTLALSEEARGGPIDHPEDRQFILDSIEMISKFIKSDGAPTLRGVTWPNYSKGEGILVINDHPKVERTVAHKERCRTVFPFLEKA